MNTIAPNYFLWRLAGLRGIQSFQHLLHDRVHEISDNTACFGIRAGRLTYQKATESWILTARTQAQHRQHESFDDRLEPDQGRSRSETAKALIDDRRNAR
jgi:hypothetical protein